VTADPGGFVASGGRLVDGQTEAVGQRFDLHGVPVGSAFQLVAPYPDYELHIGSDAAGRVVASWQNGLGGFGSQTEPKLFSRRFGADGALLGDAVQVNGYTTEDAFYPDVAVAADGSFLVIWQAGVGPYIFAQRYDADGQAAGAVVQVSESTDGLRPAVTALADGSFVVTWISGFGSHSTLWARCVLRDNLGDEVSIADNPANSKHPKVAALRDGFVVAWPAYVDYEHGNVDTDIWAGTFDALCKPRERERPDQYGPHERTTPKLRSGACIRR
jgi:hypothetical protein